MAAQQAIALERLRLNSHIHVPVAAVAAAVQDNVRKALIWLREAIAARRLAALDRLWCCLGAAAIAFSLVVLSLPVGPSPSVPPPLASADVARQAVGPQSPPVGQDRPPAGSGAQFTQGNIRYCLFQQVRLEAVGPVTDSAELVIFSALIDDWNARCARYRSQPSDKEVVEAEVLERRPILEVEGRALMSGWQRQVVTAIQHLPGPAPITSWHDPALATLPIVNDASSASGSQSQGSGEPLPPLIALGRSGRFETGADAAPPLKMPALILLRPEAALRVQERLNELGYVVRPADGTWGPTSRSALGRFKRANGLLWNDAFDAETATRLFSAAALTAAATARSQAEDSAESLETVYPPPPGASLNPLNRSDGQRIQRRLAELGYYAGNRDGLWGAGSRRALRDFKAMNGLANDEGWDAITEVVVNDEQAVRASEAPLGNPRRAGSTSTAAASSPKQGSKAAPPARSAERKASHPREIPKKPPAPIPVPSVARSSGDGSR